MQVQVLSSAPAIKSDYSGFFLLSLSLPTLVPENGTQKVYFVCMPINRIAAGHPAAFSALIVNLKAPSACILEVTVEFKVYIKAAVLVFVDVYLPNE